MHIFISSYIDALRTVRALPDVKYQSINQSTYVRMNAR